MNDTVKESASATMASGKVSSPNLTPRTFHAMQHSTGDLIELGVYTGLRACMDDVHPASKGMWPLVESEVNNWIKLVKSHPEPTAYFLLDYTEGTLEYYGDYPTKEDAVAARVKVDPDESKGELLNTAKLRTWKTSTSE